MRSNLTFYSFLLEMREMKKPKKTKRISRLRFGKKRKNVLWLNTDSKLVWNRNDKSFSLVLNGPKIISFESNLRAKFMKLQPSRETFKLHEHQSHHKSHKKSRRASTPFFIHVLNFISSTTTSLKIDGASRIYYESHVCR